MSTNDILGILIHTRGEKQSSHKEALVGNRRCKAGGYMGGAGVPVSGLGARGHGGRLARQSTTWQAAQQLKARRER